MLLSTMEFILEKFPELTFSGSAGFIISRLFSNMDKHLSWEVSSLNKQRGLSEYQHTPLCQLYLSFLSVFL